MCIRDSAQSTVTGLLTLSIEVHPPTQRLLLDAELTSDRGHRPARVDHQLYGLVLVLRSELPTCVSHNEHPLLRGVHRSGSRPQPQTRRSEAEPHWETAEQRRVCGAVRLEDEIVGSCRDVGLMNVSCWMPSRSLGIWSIRAACSGCWPSTGGSCSPRRCSPISSLLVVVDPRCRSISRRRSWCCRPCMGSRTVKRWPRYAPTCGGRSRVVSRSDTAVTTGRR